MAAAFVLGAEAVQMGTRLLASADSPVHGNLKQAVVDTDEKGVTLQLVDLAVMAKADGSAEAGAEVRAKLTEANIEERRVRFELV